ncbi:MAG: hypothetical protein ACOX6I_07955 [Syntrophomonadaceae bacterium]|jgi:hypothetical protein
MTKYDFEILKTEVLNKIAGTKDYDTRVIITKKDRVIFDDVLKVRKSKSGIFPETDVIKKKISSASIRKELVDEIKEYFKKVR